jgi:hypothetical protein
MHIKKVLFAWQVYKALHPVFRFRSLSPNMLNFIKNNILQGTTISIDSFPYPLMKEIQFDKIIELTNSEIIWNRLNVKNINFVDSYDKIVENTQYNNIMLTGLTEFKYKSINRCATIINKFAPMLKQQGNIIVAIPITTLLFHRLKFSYDQIINELDLILSLGGLTISDRLFDIDIFYIKITKL